VRWDVAKACTYIRFEVFGVFLWAVLISIQTWSEFNLRVLFLK